MKNQEEKVGNVVKGRWKIKSKKEVVIPELDVLEMQENLVFCDNLTEALMVQMIHTIRENAFEVDADDFLRDMGFIIESVRACLYREVGYGHPMAKVMSAFTKTKLPNEKEDEDDHYRGLNDAVMNKIIEGLDDEEKDPKTPA